jgi:hypothetical protein
MLLVLAIFALSGKGNPDVALSRSLNMVLRYRILPKSAHTIIAQTCPGVLLCLVKDINSGNLTLARDTTQHWVGHSKSESVAYTAYKHWMKALFYALQPFLFSWRFRDASDAGALDRQVEENPMTHHNQTPLTVITRNTSEWRNYC